jgi:hypothetical protein
MKRGRNQRRRQGMNINRALDSNGPDVRIRGTANQIYDKYLALARDASSSGDRVKAENYLQHAEHYFRVIRAMQPAQPPQGEMMDADAEQPSIGGDDRMQRRENGGDERREGGPEEEGEGYEQNLDRQSGERAPGDQPQADRAQDRQQGRDERQGFDRGPREGGERYANGQHHGHQQGDNGGDRRGRRRRPRRHHQGGEGESAQADQAGDDMEPADTAAE